MDSNIADKFKPMLPYLPAILLAGLALLMVSCHFIVPQQGWSKKWGPLVPHQTFPGDCSLCHVPDSWSVLKEDFSFDHAKQAGYPLEGAHAGAACLRCHNDRGPVQAYVARGCAGCHVDPHAGSLGLSCEKCHSQMSWRPQGLVAEHANTRFPLIGIHAVTACESCHPRAPVGFFMGAPTQCELCHQQDLARARSPDHQVNGWVNNCDRCHSQAGWSQANFNHSFFPLSGGHAGLDCLACHTSGNFGAAVPDCYSCHQDDYQSAPNHVSSGYSQNCQQCHTINGWDSANINHSFFPLTAGHGGLECTQCHTSGSFGPLPTDCYACHQTDYQGAENHVAMGFPTDCQQCHTTAGWSGASLNHRFPLSGNHNVSCTTCHQGGSTATFTCLVCHEHSQTTMDAKHNEVRNYMYASAACYQCHPNGRE